MGVAELDLNRLYRYVPELEQLRDSKQTTRAERLRALLETFGFEVRNAKSSHSVASHRDFSDIYQTIKLHNGSHSDRGAVANICLAVIDRLEKLKLQTPSSQDIQEEDTLTIPDWCSQIPLDDESGFIIRSKMYPYVGTIIPPNIPQDSLDDLLLTLKSREEAFSRDLPKVISDCDLYISGTDDHGLTLTSWAYNVDYHFPVFTEENCANPETILNNIVNETELRDELFLPIVKRFIDENGFFQTEVTSERDEDDLQEIRATYAPGQLYYDSMCFSKTPHPKSRLCVESFCELCSEVAKLLDLYSSVTILDRLGFSVSEDDTHIEGNHRLYDDITVRFEKFDLSDIVSLSRESLDEMTLESFSNSLEHISGNLEAVLSIHRILDTTFSQIKDREIQASELIKELSVEGKPAISRMNRIGQINRAAFTNRETRETESFRIIRIPLTIEASRSGPKGDRPLPSVADLQEIKSKTPNMEPSPFHLKSLPKRNGGKDALLSGSAISPMPLNLGKFKR